MTKHTVTALRLRFLQAAVRILRDGRTAAEVPQAGSYRRKFPDRASITYSKSGIASVDPAELLRSKRGKAQIEAAAELARKLGLRKE